MPCAYNRPTMSVQLHTQGVKSGLSLRYGLLGGEWTMSSLANCQCPVCKDGRTKQPKRRRRRPKAKAIYPPIQYASYTHRRIQTNPSGSDKLLRALQLPQLRRQKPGYEPCDLVVAARVVLIRFAHRTATKTRGLKRQTYTPLSMFDL